MPGVKMVLHGGNCVAHQAKGHEFIGLTLMFNQCVNVAGSMCCLQGIEDI